MRCGGSPLPPPLHSRCPLSCSKTAPSAALCSQSRKKSLLRAAEAVYLSGGGTRNAEPQISERVSPPPAPLPAAAVRSLPPTAELRSLWGSDRGLVDPGSQHGGGSRRAAAGSGPRAFTSGFRPTAAPRGIGALMPPARCWGFRTEFLPLPTEIFALPPPPSTPLPPAPRILCHRFYFSEGVRQKKRGLLLGSGGSGPRLTAEPQNKSQ